MHWDTFKQDNYSAVGGDGGRPTIRVLSYSNCQRSTHYISKWIFRNLALEGLIASLAVVEDESENLLITDDWIETTLGVIKWVCTLTHAYPHKQKPLRKMKVTICNHQVDNPLCVWPDVWSDDLQVLKKCGHTWHRMSLLRPGVIKQHATPWIETDSWLNRKWVVYIEDVDLWMIFWTNCCSGKWKIILTKVLWINGAKVVWTYV